MPPSLPASAPLVVVLHGCTQTAAIYDEGSGWSNLADRYGFALLFPEQQRQNNSNLCFNWFQPGDAVRGQGEAASIRQMIEAMIDEHQLDPKRVFVTGLSAGGAMASVMLAAYPEVFAGGAIIAGLPFGCAESIAGAFECMGGRGRRSGKALGDKVRRASDHRGPWPRVSVWHGSADHTVAASNGDDVVMQWLDVHGLPGRPQLSEKVENYPHRVWLAEDGEPLVEQYVITGMAHGTPLAPGAEPGQSGLAGPHMLDAAISSTDRIAAFWGIAGPAASALPRSSRPAKTAPVGAGVQHVIEGALRAAGLMR